MSERPTWNTWEGGTGTEGVELARRPTIDDLGGDEKEDEVDEPPDPIRHGTAQGWNQHAKQIHALGKVAESCKLEVRFDGGGVPYVARCTAPSGLTTNATFTPTDEGTGITLIEWPADTFPPFTISPNGLTLYSSSSQVVAGHVEEVTNGIRVRTFVNGAAANVGWSINLN